MPTRNQSPTKRGVIRTGLLITAGTLAVASVLIVAALTSPTSATSAQSPEITNQLRETQPLLILAHLGVSPEHLAVAGVNASQANTVIANVKAFAESHGEAFDNAVREDSQTRHELAKLQERKTRGEMIDEAALSNASSRAATASQSLTALMNQARTSALAGLTDAQRTALSNLQKNQGWAVPLEHKVTSRTESEWVQLQAAYANLRNPTEDEASNRNAERMVASASAHADVAAAKATLAAKGEIETIFLQLLPSR